MKIRLLSSALILISILLFSACGEEKAELRLTPFKGNVTVECEGETYEGNLIFSSADKSEFTLSFPERSAGLNFSYNGGSKTLIQGDVEVSAEDFGGIFNFLEVLCAFGKNSYTMPMTGVHKISLSRAGEEYTVTFSADEGNVKVIEGGGLVAIVGYQQKITA